MAITYRQPLPGVTVPVLHRVVYGSYDKTYSRHTAQDIDIDEWLSANCRHSYYHSPSYLREKAVEFECDEDAVLFALRWV